MGPRITDVDLVTLQAQIYAADPRGFFDDIEQPATDDGWCWGIKYVPRGTIVCLRGSISLQDWFRDAISQAVFIHPKIGPLAFGFSRGLDDAYAAIAPLIRGWPIIIGHSLGAARALELGGLFTMNHRPAHTIVTWGSPKPGFGQLARTLVGGGTKLRAYRNRVDPVFAVPFDLPVEPFVHPEGAPIALSETVRPDGLDLLADHHIALYAAGVAAQRPVPVIFEGAK